MRLQSIIFAKRKDQHYIFQHIGRIRTLVTGCHQLLPALIIFFLGTSLLAIFPSTLFECAQSKVCRHIKLSYSILPYSCSVGLGHLLVNRDQVTLLN